jgi:hypothetical protein
MYFVASAERGQKRQEAEKLPEALHNFCLTDYDGQSME